MSLSSEEICGAIKASPELTQLANLRKHDEIARQLSEGRTRHIKTVINSQSLASHLGMEKAEEILLALEDIQSKLLNSPSKTAVVLGSALRRQLSFMAGERGVDFGDGEFLTLIDRMVAMKVWTEAQGAALRGISLVDDPVTGLEVANALEGKE